MDNSKFPKGLERHAKVIECLKRIQNRTEKKMVQLGEDIGGVSAVSVEELQRGIVPDKDIVSVTLDLIAKRHKNKIGKSPEAIKIPRKMDYISSDD